MKTTLLFGVCWLFITGLFFTHKETSCLTGIVKGDGEVLLAAAVKVYKGHNLVKEAITDWEGRYKIILEPGAYDVEFTYVGFKTQKKKDVVLPAGKTVTLDATLESSALQEVVIVKHDKTTRAKDESRESAPGLYSPASGEAKPAPATKTAPTDDVITGSDGRKKRLEVVHEPETYEEKVIMLDVEDGSIYSAPDKPKTTESLAPKETNPGIIPQPAPRAGLLTAGEWNDLHNWNHHWADLLTDGEIAAYEEMYGFFPERRYTVFLTNNLDVPVPDAPVQLKSNGSIIWEARTDNTGKAELWAGLYDKKEYNNLTAEAWVAGQKFEITSLKNVKSGYNFLKINTECNAPKNVDIVWAVDATGSMGDELEYLKTELLDVIARVQRKNPELNIRMGATFYRDKGDDYVVKSSSLSPDIHQTVDFIRQQYAAGGGDYPEAVHSALEEVMYKQPWTENAIARICFLVLDASPHNNPEVNTSLQKSIREAARHGIRIVPVTASGIQKDTEFLMKFFGLATNGTYLFLTDHSGIGGKHLEPTSDEYKIEALNDLLVRIITEYTSIESCEGKSSIRFEDDPQQQPGQVLLASYYPNPAVDHVTLELPLEVQSVTLYDSEGKSVRKLEKPQAGINVIQVGDLAPGFYTIRILCNGRMQSGKLMVMRN